MHVDMDAFFASVEQLDHPEWRGKPVIVGGRERGVVSAASYEARRFGVRSAMPSATARKLCPHGIFTHGSMHRYAEVSAQVMQVLERFSPIVEKASVDEAYIDATGCDKLFGPPENMGFAIKRAVRETTGLTCSIGIAPVKFLAKIASDYNKPDGLFLLRDDDVPAFLQSLPVGKVPGVGKRFMAELEKIGVATCGDVISYPESFWTRRFGKGGISLWRRSQGIDSREVETTTEAKSESAEHTLKKDTSDVEELKTWLLYQSERVGRSQRRHGVKGRTVVLKVKFADFKQITRSRTLPEPTNNTEVIYHTACELLKEVDVSPKVRLIGVGVTNYSHGPEQLSLLGGMKKCGQTGTVVATDKQRRLDEAMDKVRDRFGTGAILRGRLFNSEKGRETLASTRQENGQPDGLTHSSNKKQSENGFGKTDQE